MEVGKYRDRGELRGVRTLEKEGRLKKERIEKGGRLQKKEIKDPYYSPRKRGLRKGVRWISYYE